jgi:hypothetical protein
LRGRAGPALAGGFERRWAGSTDIFKVLSNLQGGHLGHVFKGQGSLISRGFGRKQFFEKRRSSFRFKSKLRL